MYSNRRLYQALGLSPRELFGLPTRYLRAATSRESEFEKPYLTEDYGLMQALPPMPGWLGGPKPGKHNIVAGGNLLTYSHCRVRCTKYSMIECQESYRCSFSALFGWLWNSPSGQPFPDSLRAQALAEADLIKGTSGYEWFVFGLHGGVSYSMDGYVLWIYPPIGGWTGGQLDVLKIIASGVSCDTVIIVSCEEEEEEVPDPGTCCFDPDYTFDWDWETSPEVIDRGESKAISVLGGCPPYDWILDGTDFLLERIQTTEPVNILHAGAASCGTAKLTVKDACEVEVTGSIRSTYGQWVSVGHWQDCGGTWGSLTVYDIVKGGNKYDLNFSHYYSASWWGSSAASCANEYNASCGGGGTGCANFVLDLGIEKIKELFATAAGYGWLPACCTIGSGCDWFFKIYNTAEGKSVEGACATWTGNGSTQTWYQHGELTSMRKWEWQC